MAKPISLPSQKKLQELFDYRDGELYWKEKIHPSIDLSKPAGYVEKSGYRGIRIEGKVYRAHRLVRNLLIILMVIEQTIIWKI